MKREQTVAEAWAKRQRADRLWGLAFGAATIVAGVGILAFVGALVLWGISHA